MDSGNRFFAFSRTFGVLEIQLLEVLVAKGSARVTVPKVWIVQAFLGDSRNSTYLRIAIRQWFTILEGDC